VSLGDAGKPHVDAGKSRVLETPDVGHSAHPRKRPPQG
jgi:hypothetical protein